LLPKAFVAKRVSFLAPNVYQQKSQQIRSEVLLHTLSLSTVAAGPKSSSAQVTTQEEHPTCV
jgi:hypothetical protein